MSASTTISIKTDILAENSIQGIDLRRTLQSHKTKMINLMASPGSGKTSVILATIEQIKQDLSFAVIEGDIESMVDSNKVKDHGVAAVQINTGGACHLDVPMIKPALNLIDLPKTDIIFVENIGNLVCPAEFDIGENLKVMILSVPEGHDKILKYPLMFSVVDVLIVNKIDYLELPSNNFDLDWLINNARSLNPKIKIFPLSAYTGEGMAEWCSFLKDFSQTK